MNKIDLTGKRYGRLTVLHEAINSIKKGVVWMCKCECGALKEISPYELKIGKTISCGCYRNDIIKRNMTTHGLSSNKSTYTVWRKMKERCLKESCPSFKNYGGRGIKICDDWIKDFKSFHSWCLLSGYKKGLFIDRIDNNGDYEPKNCKWSSYKQQNRNRRSNRYVTYKGERRTFAEWCEMLNISYSRTHQRFHKYGWTLVESFEKP